MISLLTISIILFIIGVLLLLLFFGNSDSAVTDVIGFVCIIIGYILACIY